jgi:hypothetical protein
MKARPCATISVCRAQPIAFLSPGNLWPQRNEEPPARPSRTTIYEGNFIQLFDNLVNFAAIPPV